MMGRIGLIFAICLCLLVVSSARELEFGGKDESTFNNTLGIVLAHYAAAAYANSAQLFRWTCLECRGYTQGFKVIKVVVDVQHCLQAYVGVARDPNAIIIAFRGTEARSMRNWFADIKARQIPLNYPGMSGAMVHRGFLNTYQNTTIRPQILSAFQQAKNSYGDLKIIVTGHSLGGAMAAICGLDLVVNQKAQNVQVVTFGQPRVGNTVFALHYSKILPNTFRVVNANDMVPHLPSYRPHLSKLSFHHTPREVWLHGMTEKVCDDSGEDPTCSRSVTGNTVEHLPYYGFMIASALPGACNGILHPSVLADRKTDSGGNYILSKDPAT